MDVGWLYRELDEGKGCLEVAKDDRVGTQALGKKRQYGSGHLQMAGQRLARLRTWQIQENFWGSVTQNVIA